MRNSPQYLWIAQPNVARFATDGLASYGTTAGERHSVQKRALIASRHASKVIANGYADFTPSDDRDEALAALFRSSEFWSKEPAQ